MTNSENVIIFLCNKLSFYLLGWTLIPPKLALKYLQWSKTYLAVRVCYDLKEIATHDQRIRNYTLKQQTLKIKGR